MEKIIKLPKNPKVKDTLERALEICKFSRREHNIPEHTEPNLMYCSRNYYRIRIIEELLDNKKIKPGKLLKKLKKEHNYVNEKNFNDVKAQIEKIILNTLYPPF